MLGIKESKELLAGIEVLAVGGLDIAVDGISWDDAAKAIALAKQSDVIVEAVKGLDLIDDEIKDLDQAELLELGVAAFATVKAIAAAAKKLSVK